MGYSLILKMISSKHFLLFKECYFPNTAQITSHDIPSDNVVPQNVMVTFNIEDKNNSHLLDISAKKKLEELQESSIPIMESDIAQFQYLKFGIGSETFYICIHTGVSDTFGDITIFPKKEPFPLVEGNFLIVDDYFKQNVWIEFR